MESLGRLVNLNVLLSLHTIQTAESEDLIDLRYLSITSAQIIDLPIKYVSVGKNLDKHSSSWKTKQNETEQRYQWLYTLGEANFAILKAVKAN